MRTDILMKMTIPKTGMKPARHSMPRELLITEMAVMSWEAELWTRCQKMPHFLSRIIMTIIRRSVAIMPVR